MTQGEVVLHTSDHRALGHGVLAREDIVVLDEEAVENAIGPLLPLLRTSPTPLRVETPTRPLSVTTRAPTGGEHAVSSLGSLHVVVTPGVEPAVAVGLAGRIDARPAAFEELPERMQDSMTRHLAGAQGFPRSGSGPSDYWICDRWPSLCRVHLPPRRP